MTVETSAHGSVPAPKLCLSQEDKHWTWPAGQFAAPSLEHEVRLCLVSTGFPVDPRKVLIVAGHHNWIVAAYAHFAVCYRYCIVTHGVLFIWGGRF